MSPTPVTERGEGSVSEDTLRHTTKGTPMTEVTIAAEREALIYGDGRGQAHVLTDPRWAADRLTYLERAVLAARLRALAELVDPGSLATYELRTATRLGAESVTHP